MEKKETKKRTYDAVGTTRRIRNRHYEKTKNMTREERLAYYREKGQEAHEGPVQKVKEQSGRAA